MHNFYTTVALIINSFKNIIKYKFIQNKNKGVDDYELYKQSSCNLQEN